MHAWGRGDSNRENRPKHFDFLKADNIGIVYCGKKLMDRICKIL
jgi:hypothetical protein